MAKVGKLLFAIEHGAGALKGKTLNILDPVVFGMLILTITILILTMYFK